MPALNQAILFNLDDTLFDHQHCTRCGLGCMQQFFPQLAPVPLRELEAVHRHLLETLHAQVLQGRLTMEAARLLRFQGILRHFQIEATPDELHQIAADYRSIYQAARRAVPGALALLHALRPHVRLGIISNNLAEEQYEKLRVCGLEPLFDCVVISAEVGLAKPDPAIFQLALAWLGCTPSQALMLGDNWTYDIVPAAALGMRTVWLNRYGAACPDPHTSAEITSLEPLEQMLTRLLPHHRATRDAC